jgi:hypothetical protein
MFKKIKKVFQVKKPGDYLKYEIMGFVLLIVIITLGVIYVPKLLRNKLLKNGVKETYFDDHEDMDQSFMDMGLGIDTDDIDSEGIDWKEKIKVAPKCKFYPKGDTKISCIDRCMNPYDNYKWGGKSCTESICGEICNGCKNSAVCKWVKDESVNKMVPDKVKIIGLTGSDNTGNYIRLNWVSPESPSKILRYSVIVESDDSSTDNEVRIDFVPDVECKNCEYVVYNLRSNINYRIFVIAKNKYGNSERSNTILGKVTSDKTDALSAVFDSDTGNYEKDDEGLFKRKPKFISQINLNRTINNEQAPRDMQNVTLDKLKTDLGINFKPDNTIKNNSSYSQIYNVDGSINSIYQSKLGDNEFRKIVANMVYDKIDDTKLKQSYNIKVV